LEKPKGKSPLGRPGHRWDANVRMKLKKKDGVVWTGLNWLRIGTNGGILWKK
jgi:hypothetical protein